MKDFTLHELTCFEAVVSEGGFHAAATLLNRSHPAIYSAVKGLETRMGVTLLDRSGYRVSLTPEGNAFLERARHLLADAKDLQHFAQHLAQGDETDLHIVIGDLCPTTDVVGLLRRFFDDCSNTRLHLHFETLAGPLERLLEGTADLILHHVDKANPQLEFIDLFSVSLIPVVAPGFLPFPVNKHITPRQMRDQVQCVIRDSAKLQGRDYHIIEGAHSWTVADQLMKKELILLGMGWGHMPLHLIEQELENDKLLSIEGTHFKRVAIDIVAARLRNQSTGPVADRLWHYLKSPQDS